MPSERSQRIPLIDEITSTKSKGTTTYVEYVTDEITSVKQRHAGALPNYATKTDESTSARLHVSMSLRQSAGARIYYDILNTV